MTRNKIGTQSNWKSQKWGSLSRNLATMPKTGSTLPGGSYHYPHHCSPTPVRVYSIDLFHCLHFNWFARAMFYTPVLPVKNEFLVELPDRMKTLLTLLLFIATCCISFSKYFHLSYLLYVLISSLKLTLLVKIEI